MNKNLPKIVADLFAQSKADEDQSAKIRRIRGEIKKVIESEDEVFGKLLGLVASFREIIPDEKQRYQAALKALSTTSKLSAREILTAISAQFEELKIVEKSLLPALPGLRDELKAMETRSLEVKGELSKLREKIMQFENEEKAILTAMASRQKDKELAEKTMKELFADIGAEIASTRKKVEEFSAETPAVPPVPQKAPVISEMPGGKKEGGGQEIAIKADAPPADTKFQKKCPMCGGRYNLLELQNLWQCFTCGHEEPTTGFGQGISQAMSAPTPGPVAGPSPSIADPLASTIDEGAGPANGSSASDRKPAVRKKTCPSCRRKMFWYPDEKAWRCPDCHYERRI